MVDEVMTRSTCKFEAFLLTGLAWPLARVFECSRFELAVLLSSLRDSCQLGVGEKEREG